jgi:hypothetical protein
MGRLTKRSSLNSKMDHVHHLKMPILWALDGRFAHMKHRSKYRNGFQKGFLSYCMEAMFDLFFFPWHIHSGPPSLANTF